MGQFTYILAVVVLGIAYVAYDKLSDLDVLSTFNEDIVLNHYMIQAALFGFCLNTEALDNLLAKDDAEEFDMHQADMEETNFLDDGNINEDDYTKQSIYSVLYSIYADLENLQHRGEKYQFRFNTWGVTGVMNKETGEKNGTPQMSVGTENAEGAAKNKNNLIAYPETQPQKAGKIAYASLLNFEAVKKYIKEKRKTLGEGEYINIVEIGSGTGAGANELSWLHPYVNYTAIDMQAPGTALCKKIHASDRLVAPQPGNDEKPKPQGVFEELIEWDHRLTCIQHNGQYLDRILPAGFADIVLISETHIADVVPLDIETKRVFDQMYRLLKPNGYFVWGNAIPTSIWEGSFRYLQNEMAGGKGMIRREVHDVTDNAVQARDDDYSRAIDFFRQGKEVYYGLAWFPECSWSINRLIMNFYRQPGTALYKRMLVHSNATKPAGEYDGLCGTDEAPKNCWCRVLSVPTSLCDDRRIDSYVHMAYQKRAE